MTQENNQDDCHFGYAHVSSIGRCGIALSHTHKRSACAKIATFIQCSCKTPYMFQTPDRKIKLLVDGEDLADRHMQSRRVI